MDSFIQSKKSFQQVLFWSSLFLIVGNLTKNIWYYPSFFDLVYWIDSVSLFLTSQVDGDASLFIESFNSWASILINGILILSLALGFTSRSWSSPFLVAGWIGIVLIFLGEWNETNLQWAYFMESLMRLTVIPLYLLRNWDQKRLFNLLLVTVVITFAGHGLFALNVFPRPAHFVDMVIKAFGFSESNANLFLNVVGVLDLTLLGLVWIKPVRRWLLIYMMVWGFLTAIARPVLNISWVFFVDSLIIWIPELFNRVAHFLIPLGLYWEMKRNN
ncbi:MAG: hypothetical protein CL840_10020 [Crocinitomicaceae bacterium]|nr:hypothetical protein [Crocinitomicaceae bacterium]|tara:strand:- start:11054 stop:11872 length:819 start_codon:yes stop_codon:yes gene_type:complete